MFDRLWAGIEDRYAPEDVGCDCGSASRGQAVLDETELTMADLRAYQRGDRSMAELVSTVDADLDTDPIDDLETLIVELRRVIEAGQPDPDPTSER